MRLGRRPYAARACCVAAAALVAAGAATAAFAAPAPAQGAGKTEAQPNSSAFSLRPLNPKDARAYAAAFAAVRAGRFSEAETLAAQASDPLLAGRLDFAKLMHPDYRASYEELSDWLARYGDQPGAERIYALARKRQPASAPSPAAPRASAGSDAAIWARVETLARRYETTAPAKAAPPAASKSAADSAGAQASREAYYAGEVEKAYDLAVKAGERWIAGLAAFRLDRFDEARARFASLAEDGGETDWVRSGAAYWAARSSIAAGAPEAAPHYLGLAARTPYTFYGLIAERQLGLEPAVTADGLDPAAVSQPVMRGATISGPAGAAVAKLVATDRQARRAAAFAQLGMTADAGAELRAGLAAAGAGAREAWTRLALSLNAPLTSSEDLPRKPRFDIADFPTPELAPEGGFVLDKALVYALVRQESRFRADATGGGAYGLMQLMPATAARVSGDDKLRKNPSLLKDPAINLKLGQTYVTRLLAAVDGDLLHAIAAYNTGPAVIQKTLAKLGRDADSLLAIESIPGASTREFVEKVAAGYWIYRNIFGMDSPTLDAAASSKKAVAVTLDDAAARTPSKLGSDLASLFSPQD